MKGNKMKTLKLLAVAAFISLISNSVLAGNATDELVNQMYSEREEIIGNIVNGWIKGESEDKLAESVYRLVDIQVRLQCIDSSAMRDFGGKLISEAGLSKVKNKEKLTAAVGLAYYRLKGLTVNTRNIFADKSYLVKTPGKM